VDASLEAPQKRYRFTGKERDEVTGFYYHGARYYAPWLGRWTACDPIGIKDGIDLYVYGRNSPVIFLDPNGMQTGASEGSVLTGTVDPMLQKKGLPYNTETTLELTLKDGTVVTRRFDRFYQDPSGKWVAVEAKGSDTTKLTANELLADKKIQTEGARFRVIKSAGVPPPGHGKARMDIPFTKNYVGQLEVGQLQYVVGGATSSMATGTQPAMMSAGTWSRWMDQLPDAVPHPGMVRKLNANGVPTWVTPAQIAADYKRITGRELNLNPVSRVQAMLTVRPTVGQQAAMSQATVGSAYAGVSSVAAVLIAAAVIAPEFIAPEALALGEAVPATALTVEVAANLRIATQAVEVAAQTGVRLEEALEEYEAITEAAERAAEASRMVIPH
jgi:RHS repeat-associated protein